MSAASTATATAIEATVPIIPMKGIPETQRPQIATITVNPANSTAWPEVAMARPTASSTASPRCRPSRYRVTMNSA
ncbi:MAG: hypothetical protein KatS3mg014_0564 [Actinomycetota bacterium]|nr:MAG: hypothetical protein KatS3mg014_0564 [Actinomycetota bacterium]